MHRFTAEAVQAKMDAVEKVEDNAEVRSENNAFSNHSGSL